MDGLFLGHLHGLQALAQADLLNKRHCLCYSQSHSRSPPWSLCPTGGRSRVGSQVVPLKCFTQVLVGIWLFRQHFHSLPFSRSA